MKLNLDLKSGDLALLLRALDRRIDDLYATLQSLRNQGQTDTYGYESLNSELHRYQSLRADVGLVALRNPEPPYHAPYVAPDVPMGVPNCS